MGAPDQTDILTYGEAMALFAARESGPLKRVTTFARTTAGAELNVAVGFARLGFRTAYLSRVGDDALGHGLLEAMDREGIDRTHVTVDPRYPTGMMLKSRTDDGSDPAIEYFRKGSAASHLSIEDFSASHGQNTRALHLTGIAPAISPSSRELAFHMANSMRGWGKFISFDPNLRPQLWASQADMVECLNRLAAHADLVLPGVKEGRLLSGYEHPEDIARFYLDLGARAVVIKLGAQGAYFRSETESGVVPGVPVAKVVDTVGAGDGFGVGVVSAMLEGFTLRDAAARGNAIGARVIQFPGDCDGLPTRAELDAVVSQ